MSRGSSGRGSKGRGKHSNRSKSHRTSVKMSKERARAIQKHADRNNTNQGFKGRAMSAAEKNEQESN